MLHNTVSSNKIIAKVFSDLNVKEGNFRVNDAIEWVGEALEAIGAYPYYNVKITGRENEPYLILADYQTLLPSDVYKVIAVAYSPTANGIYTPMRYADGIFSARVINTNSTSSTSLQPTSEVVNLARTLYNWDYETALSNVNSDSVLRAKLNTVLSLTDGPNIATSNAGGIVEKELTYFLNNGYIKCNVRSGSLMLVYQAIPTDIDGYPVVPNDPGVIEALYWYINMKLLYADWRQGLVRDRVYEHAEFKWYFYKNQAYGSLMMPNVDQMESIKNNWLSLIPNISEFNNLFVTLGQTKQVYQ